MVKITYRGFQIGGTGRDARLRSISGLLSRTLNAFTPDLPRSHGALVGASYEMPKRVRISFAVAADRRLDALAAFAPLVDAEETAVFDELAGLPTLTLGCRATRCDIPIEELGEHDYAIANVELEATDPALYGNALLTETLTPFAPSAGLSYPVTYPKAYGAGGSGAGTIVTNAGLWQTWPTLKINGPTSGTLTDPIVENVTTGKKLELTANGGVSIVSGQQLIIESHPSQRSVEFSTGASRYGKLSEASEFWPLEPGDNELRFRASGATTGASCVVEYRSAWI